MSRRKRDDDEAKRAGHFEKYEGPPAILYGPVGVPPVPDDLFFRVYPPADWRENTPEKMRERFLQRKRERTHGTDEEAKARLRAAIEREGYEI